eukprot:7970519-Alexandrium_andersonii.AAC.1
MNTWPAAWPPRPCQHAWWRCKAVQRWACQWGCGNGRRAQWQPSVGLRPCVGASATHAVRSMSSEKAGRKAAREAPERSTKQGA